MSIQVADSALLEASDLAGFPGGPFAAGVVASACALLRSHADWHIAPEVTEDLIVESHGGREVYLPTLMLTEITEVRDITTGDGSTILTGYWTVATDKFKGGVVTRPGGWPVGLLSFTVQHGFNGCPPDLAGAVAELCRGYVRGDLASRSLGDRSESWLSGMSNTTQQAINHYTIPGSP